jgi:membrane protein DedA with SNARE-associated domain
MAYLSTYIAAIIEGEIVYIGMCVAAAAGKFAWQGVLIAGALGGATGDQIWFYLLRGRLDWLDRYPWMARHRDAVVHRVQDNEKLILLISRFLPGLRVAIPVASAYAGVKPLHFSLLNLASAFMWASAIMLVVTKIGPSAMDRIGLHGPWALVVPAVIVVVFFKWLGRPRRKRHKPGTARPKE